MPTLAAPSLLLFATEPLRGVRDHLAGARTDVARWPRGDGRPVLVYPGLGTSGRATARLRATLRSLGYDPRDWPLGLNRGPRGAFDAYLDPLAAQVERIADASGRRPSLVGWSLGGVYARELARRLPGVVRGVVTLGSPIRGGPEATRAGPLYALLNRTRPVLEPKLRARLARPVAVPHVALWSRDDGVVAWRGCRASGAGARNVEVPGVSHLGLVAHPVALRCVADALARHA